MMAAEPGRMKASGAMPVTVRGASSLALMVGAAVWAKVTWLAASRKSRCERMGVGLGR
jgi:hypothetical protein